MVARHKIVAPYEPFPWQLPALQDKSQIMLLTGAAGGGKSRCGLEKLHAFLMRYPGAMGLMARKTRESMTNSTVLFFMQKVLGDDPKVVYKQHKNRFEYWNGSILAFGGMADKRQREQIRSIGADGGLDIVLLEEAHLFTEEDFEELLPRMRGKAAPWTQIIVLTNPDHPRHWIKRRLIDGKQAAVYYSDWRDNPFNPPEYRHALDMLTGYKRRQLRDGEWCMSEAAIYPMWTEENISFDADYDPAYPIEWWVDVGYTNPTAILFAQERPFAGSPDHLCVFDEVYLTEYLEREVIKIALDLGYPPPAVVYYDTAAPTFAAEMAKAREEGRFLCQISGAYKAIADGINTVRRYIEDANGKRLLRVHPRCKNLIEEIPSYANVDTTARADSDPKPALNQNDHAVDALRYGMTPRIYRL